MIRPFSALLICALALSSCGSQARGPYGTTGEQQRDIARAEESYRESLAEDDDENRERLLRATLGFDLYHGQAHNNLGVLLLQQGRLYDAAEEFEWARKLLPGHPEPRANLALTLERGGKHADAVEAALSAIEVRPGHLGAIKLIAMVSIDEGLVDPLIDEHLDAIATRAPEPEWREWAVEQRLRRESSLNR